MSLRNLASRANLDESIEQVTREPEPVNNEPEPMHRCTREPENLVQVISPSDRIALVAAPELEARPADVDRVRLDLIAQEPARLAV